ncbi:MAG: response regulator, partial [Candidatus Binatia bacterium]
HEVVRQGVKVLIESHPDWKVCAEAVDGREAVQKANQHQPHVVIMDITMPGLNGLEATRQIRKVCPSTEVLVFTMHESEELASELFEAGACGYVVKSDVGEELVSAARSALEHRPCFTSKIGKMVLRGHRGRAAPPSPRRTAGGLTAREREVIQLVAEGKTNKEVAAELGLSVETARTHRSNILRKLNLHSTGDLVRFAVRNRIIQA